MPISELTTYMHILFVYHHGTILIDINVTWTVFFIRCRLRLLLATCQMQHMHMLLNEASRVIKCVHITLSFASHWVDLIVFWLLANAFKLSLD